MAPLDAAGAAPRSLVGGWDLILSEVDNMVVLVALALIVLAVLLWPVSKRVLKKNATPAIGFTVLVCVVVIVLIVVASRETAVRTSPALGAIDLDSGSNSATRSANDPPRVDVIELRRLVEQGNASAQVELGLRYAKGDAVLQDYQEAVRLFRQATDQNNADGQFYLGIMYLHGRGVPQRYEEAVRWFRRAACQGHGLAQNNLGYMYEHGHGMPQPDLVEAVWWYRQAANQGEPIAQINLGFMYEAGRGVVEDREAAIRWYTAAAEQGNATAQELLDGLR